MKEFILKPLKQYQVRKNQQKSWIKLSHNGDFHEYTLNRQPEEDILSKLPKQLRPIGITAERMASLKKLKSSLPLVHQSFVDKLILKECSNNENISQNF